MPTRFLDKGTHSVYVYLIKRWIYSYHFAPFIITYEQQESVSIILQIEGVKASEELQKAEIMESIYSKKVSTHLLCAEHYVEQVTLFLYPEPFPGSPTCLPPSPVIETLH